MKCGIVTPVGPGQEEAYQRCALSISIAAQNDLGPFSSIELFPIYDLDGEFGRSTARNIGVDAANEAACDWIFFIDADDLMFEDCFKNVAHLIHDYDVIWGLICEAPYSNLGQVKIRERQMSKIVLIDDILNVDPYLTLQMGLFVRTELALRHRFDPDMNTGEDFKFYLECWMNYRCIKENLVLFVNVRGNHSTGPRSANGRMWRASVSAQIKEARYQLSTFAGRSK
jgi:glycosyltransferase involved in cell wall biosynthesis